MNTICLSKYSSDVQCLLLKTLNTCLTFYINNPATLFFHILLLLLLALQPTVGFTLLSDFLPFCPFFTLLSRLFHILRDVITGTICSFQLTGI